MQDNDEYDSWARLLKTEWERNRSIEEATKARIYQHKMIMEKQALVMQREQYRIEADAARELLEQAAIFEGVLDLIRRRMIQVTPEYIQSITDPTQRQELVKAICLSKV